MNNFQNFFQDNMFGMWFELYLYLLEQHQTCTQKGGGDCKKLDIGFWYCSLRHWKIIKGYGCVKIIQFGINQI